MNGHATAEQLLEFLDGTLTASGRQDVEEHLRSCASCTKVLKEFQALDRSLHKVPLVCTSKGFSGAVLSRVLADGKEPLTFRLLTSLAYIFAMLIVLVILGVVFLSTGVLKMQNEGTEANRFQAVFDAASSTLEIIPVIMTKWITEYIPFIFGGGSLGITTAILAVVSMLFVFDRLIGWRIVGRLR
jgi:anti-sigma factor RsiW